MSILEKVNCLEKNVTYLEKKVEELEKRIGKSNESDRINFLEDIIENKLGFYIPKK